MVKFFIICLLLCGINAEAKSLYERHCVSCHEGMTITLDKFFYRYLLKSESRHFEDYLALARSISAQPIEDRIVFFREMERELIETPDTQLRFHSGALVVRATASSGT